MSRSLKEITEELYPISCGKFYAPDDVEHEGQSMSISWRMAGAIHFCLLHVANDMTFKMRELPLTPEQKRRFELWHELSMTLIEKICKAKNPKLFAEVPFDEFTAFEKATPSTTHNGEAKQQ